MFSKNSSKHHQRSASMDFGRRRSSSFDASSLTVSVLLFPYLLNFTPCGQSYYNFFYRGQKGSSTRFPHQKIDEMEGIIQAH